MHTQKSDNFETAETGLKYRCLCTSFNAAQTTRMRKRRPSNAISRGIGLAHWATIAISGDQQSQWTKGKENWKPTSIQQLPMRSTKPNNTTTLACVQYGLVSKMTNHSKVSLVTMLHGYFDSLYTESYGAHSATFPWKVIKRSTTRITAISTAHYTTYNQRAINDPVQVASSELEIIQSLRRRQSTLLCPSTTDIIWKQAGVIPNS